jgi:3-methyladenine DNA glycosylase/8-oxoguanine DNA glycosylase
MLELQLRGAGGEPVDFARTIVSHGVAELPPNALDLASCTLETTVPVLRGARTVRISESNGHATVEILAGRNTETVTRSLATTLRHMLRLDEDLSEFYELCREDPELGWCATGAGRMLRSPTVFEDVVNTTSRISDNPEPRSLRDH